MAGPAARPRRAGHRHRHAGEHQGLGEHDEERRRRRWCRCGCSTASAAVRAKASARPSTGSPRSRWASSQSAMAERLLTTSPMPARDQRGAVPPGRSRGRRRRRAGSPRRRSPCRGGAPGRPPASRGRRGRGWWPPRPSAGRPGGGVLRDVEGPAAADRRPPRRSRAHRAPPAARPAAARLASSHLRTPSASGSERLDPLARSPRPGDGPTATRTLPVAEMQRSCSSRRGSSTAPARMSTKSGLASIRASSGTRSPAPARGRRGCRPRPTTCRPGSAPSPIGTPRSTSSW